MTTSRERYRAARDARMAELTGRPGYHRNLALFALFLGPGVRFGIDMTGIPCVGDGIRDLDAADAVGGPEGDMAYARMYWSVAERISGRGLSADRKPYASKFLNPSIALSPVENTLKWADNDVKPGTDSKASIAMKARQFFEGIPGWFGITS